MKKKIVTLILQITISCLCLLILAVGLVYLTYLKEVPFIALARFDSLKNKFTYDKKIVTFPEYHRAVKKNLPQCNQIKRDEIEKYLNNDYVAVLPWWYADFKYKTLKINNNYFYNNDKGFIYIKILAGSIPEFNRGKIIQIAAGGTVVLARGIAGTIEKTKNPYLPWYGTKDFFRKADFSCVNFKSPLVYNYTKPESKWHLYGKAEYAKGLKYAGIDLVSISGNHMGDAGREGLLDTIDILERIDVVPVGAGSSKKEAYQAYYWHKKGTTFAFLAFNSVVSSITKAKSDGDAKKRPGIAWLDNDALLAVQEAKQKADIVFVIVNWGKEYMAKPEQEEINWAHKLINAGADIILGDQAHWVQNFEFYRNKFISYGLGNFIFDQYWSEKTKEGILENHIFYKNKYLGIEIKPVKLKEWARIEFVKDIRLYKDILSQFYGK